MSERYPHRWEFHGLTNGPLFILQCRCGAKTPHPLPEKFLGDCRLATKDEHQEDVEIGSKSE